jgi:hypothetical protein
LAAAVAGWRCRRLTCWAGRQAAQWFQMVKTRHKISSFDVISRFFQSNFLQIYITSVFSCLRFTFKICQIVAGTSMIRQFNEFFKFYFWRVFAIWNHCGLVGWLVVGPGSSRPNR